MIKKINIALAVVFVVLFGLKLLIDFAESAKAGKRRVAAAPVLSSETSSLAPRIYFMRWEPNFAPNVITKHNGFCLDLIREIFPNAIFDDSKNTTSVEEVRKILQTDPNAVIPDYGDMDELKEFPTAKEQTVWIDLCVYTLRKNTWAYTGPESLDQLRLGWTADLNDSAVLRAFAKKWKDTPGKVFICSEMCDSGSYFLEKIQKGELDGFVGSEGFIQSSSDRNDGKAFVRYRSSKTIDSVPLRFRCSNLDPELSKKLCQAYDDGVHRLYHSGFIHRLAEYYKKDMIAKGKGEFRLPIETYSEDK